MKKEYRFRKDPNKKKRINIVLLIVTIFVVVITAVIVVFAIINLPQKETKSTSNSVSTVDETAASTTAFITEESTTVSTSTQSEEAPPKAPKELVDLLSEQGLSVEDLYYLYCNQLVVVKSQGSSAEISYFEVNNNEWIKDDNLTTGGFVGYEGTTYEMSEYVSASPIGLYPIGQAFYIYDRPNTKLDVFEITENTYWINNPVDDNYNTKVEFPNYGNGEHMIEYSPSYDYGFVINYNMNPTIAGAGSAIFFHVAHRPTGGCIGTDVDSVLKYLSKLDENLCPYILIE